VSTFIDYPIVLNNAIGKKIITCGVLYRGLRGSLASGRLLAVLCLGYFVSGCVYQDYDLGNISKSNTASVFTDRYVVEQSNNLALPRNAKVYVARPHISLAHRVKYPSLAHDLQRAQVSATQSNFPHTGQSQKPLSVQKALHEASNRDQDFMIYPSVISWNDRQVLRSSDCKEESSLPQKKSLAQRCRKDWSRPLHNAHIVIWVYDVGTRALLDSISIKSKSGLMTFSEGRPEELLAVPMAQVIAHLAQR